MNYDKLIALIETLGVHPELGPVGQGWDIEQNPHELTTFLAALPEIHTVLEIGTGYKAGLARFMSQHLGWQVTSVDVTDYGHAYPGIEFMVNPDPRIFQAREYDLVIIDGDHAYEAVKADYELYGSRARSGAGIVMFHDIAGLRDCDGAARFWRELSYTKKGVLRQGFHEAIADGPQRAGIGWIQHA